jgi:hypothetical protein
MNLAELLNLKESLERQAENSHNDPDIMNQLEEVEEQILDAENQEFINSICIIVEIQDNGIVMEQDGTYITTINNFDYDKLKNKYVTTN